MKSETGAIFFLIGSIAFLSLTMFQFGMTIESRNNESEVTEIMECNCPQEPLAFIEEHELGNKWHFAGYVTAFVGDGFMMIESIADGTEMFIHPDELIGLVPDEHEFEIGDFTHLTMIDDWIYSASY